MSEPAERLLIVGNFFPSGSGAHGVCTELAAEMRASGSRVIETSRLKPRALRLIDMLATVWRRRADYDVAQVDVYSGFAFGWADAVSRALVTAGKPFIFTLHGGGLPQFAARHPAWVRRVLARAAVVTAPSSYLQRAMADYRAGILVVPNPIRLDDYTFRLRDAPRANLVWVRAFHDVYNPSLAPRVVARLRSQFVDVRLTMVGPDKGDGSLARARETASREGVADRVSFVGPVARSRVPSFLNDADVFVNTSNVDNTPISILEALASGLPVVTTDVGGIRSLVSGGHNALVVPPDDAEAMARAVQEVLTNADLARRLSGNGRTTAIRFAWPRVLPEWQRLFHSVAATGRPAAPRALRLSVR